MSEDITRSLKIEFPILSFFEWDELPRKGRPLALKFSAVAGFMSEGVPFFHKCGTEGIRELLKSCREMQASTEDVARKEEWNVAILRLMSAHSFFVDAEHLDFDTQITAKGLRLLLESRDCVLRALSDIPAPKVDHV